MLRIQSGMALALCAFFVYACNAGSNSACSDENPCKQGHSCNQDGICEEASPLQIETNMLPVGYLGIEYEGTMLASGGIKDYRWAIEYGPDWLVIEPASGRLSGIPTAPTSGTHVSISVTDDSYGDGQSLTKNFELVVDECYLGQLRACYLAELDHCYLGEQLCNEGKWQACDTINLSTSFDHCGTNCTACDPATANSCNGTCRCGTTQQCSAGSQCCDNACIDLTTPNLDHCGVCGVDCSESVLNVSAPVCENHGGVIECDYEYCSPGFHDCNSERSDGCEAPGGLNRCADCDNDCATDVVNASGVECLLGANQQYACGYASCADGWGDCDNDPTNGCEVDMRLDSRCGDCTTNCIEQDNDQICLFDQDQQLFRCGCQNDGHCAYNSQCCDDLCRNLHDNMYCGTCDNDCTQLAEHTHCLFGSQGTCGCINNGDCNTNRICCDNVCIDIDDENCGYCGYLCEDTNAGPHCNIELQRCYCADDGECNDHFGSAQVCDEHGGMDVDGCNCFGVDYCPDGPESQCCPAEVDGACVNLLTDPANCGRCGVECDDLANCVDGACECRLITPLAFCPLNSPARDCNADPGQHGMCVCLAFADGSGACVDGRLCCSGDMGGSGGPNNTADSGCCENPCGENVAGECVFE
jgi:hypothetical protein